MTGESERPKCHRLYCDNVGWIRCEFPTGKYIYYCVDCYPRICTGSVQSRQHGSVEVYHTDRERAKGLCAKCVSEIRSWSEADSNLGSEERADCDSGQVALDEF